MIYRLTVALLAMLLSICGAAQAAPLSLVQDGKSVAAIYLPSQTEYERAAAADPARVKGYRDEEVLAAEELQSILKLITSAELPIMRLHPNADLPETPAILLGTQLASQAGANDAMAELDKDGLHVGVYGNALVLTGSRARGTLYAVYDYLESLGCRWIMPGSFGEMYPSLASVSAEGRYSENPSHRERYWWCTYGNAPDYALWTLRNKGNFVRTPDDPKVAQGHALSGPLRAAAKNPKYAVTKTVEVETQQKQPDGTMKTVVESRQVMQLPDEYYAIADGKPNTAVPNMSNPKVWDLYAEHYVEYFKANPKERYVSLSAEDGIVTDDRPMSEALSSGEYDWMLGAPAVTDKLWFFHNRVIERVVKEVPDAKFGILVYANNMAPPRIERVHPNMALVFAPLGVSPLHHVRDAKSKTNRTYRIWLEDWMLMARAAGAETFYYDYEPMGYCWNMAMICPRWGIIGKNYPWFHELGLTGHTTQGYDDWASCGLDNYLMQRLYWDVTQDYHDVIRDYCKARFGAAADAMFDYYKVYEDRMAEIPDLYSNELWANHLVLTPAVRARAREALDKAVSLADTERAKAQVHAMVLLQRSTDAMADAIEHADATGDYRKAAEMMDTCWQVRDELNKLYPNYMNSTRLDENAKPEFFSGGMRNQFVRFADRIQAATASMVLPREWKGMLDTGNRAWSLGYHKPATDVASLDTLDVTICPDVKYGTQREVAAYFYRTTVDVSPDFARGEKVTLYMPSVIARALQIWVNGEPVMFDHGDFQDATWRGPEFFWVNYNHEQAFDVTGLIKPGQKNTVAFRVFKSNDFGGTYRRLYLLAE